jgi:urea transport system permease protein
MGELPLIAGQVFNSFSVASLFVLAALGLALSFGLMRVINMAHGEMLMLGGYLAYLVFLVVPGPLAIFVAMPVAFIGAALVGAVLEMTVIRRLAARPLDTLLATWGVSLILQQAARNISAPSAWVVTAPAWLNHTIADHRRAAGGPHHSGHAHLHHRRGGGVLAALSLLLARTRMGLLVRAVNQDRAMAAASGINVRQVDLAVFLPGRRHCGARRRGAGAARVR